MVMGQNMSKPIFFFLDEHQFAHSFDVCQHARVFIHSHIDKLLAIDP
jgi:hypothetical protein